MRSRALPASLLVAGADWPHGAAGLTAPAYRDLGDSLGGSAPFAVIGDTQESLLFEKLIGRESNPAERRRLFAELEAQRPAFLVIAGDLTAAGSSAKRWRYFDGLSAGLRALDIPILPVLGNHDLWGSNKTALRAFAARFPQFGGDHWYVRRYGALALVFLDANHDDLEADGWQREQAWFDQLLPALDADASVRGVLVFDHQPPFTNGTTTSDDDSVQTGLVPAFARAHKTLAFISGHTHAWEHFLVEQKHYLVSGGGGGPRVTLMDPERHPDLYRDPSPHPRPRPYHFLWITPGPDEVLVEARGFDKGETVFRTFDHVALRW